LSDRQTTKVRDVKRYAVPGQPRRPAQGVKQEGGGFDKVASLFPPRPSEHMAKPRPSSPPKDYESALAELEAIVGEMESGQLPLEASLSAYKRGAELLQFCRQQLANAEQQVRILEGDTLKPYPAENPDD
jgi:exodeoxyribonuclease VII small subunit